MSVTFVLAATIALSAIGAAALSMLIARFGVTGARLTYVLVGGSLALSGVLAAAALSANVGSIPARAEASHALAAPELEARIHELESVLADLESRLRMIPVRVETFHRPREIAEAIHIRVTGRASAER
jgi:hypothetical protein